MRRALAASAIGYALGSLVLALYGTAVCPLMAGLSSPVVAGAVALGGALALAVELVDRRVRPGLEPSRRWLLQWWVWGIPPLMVAATEWLFTGGSAALIAGSALKMAIGSYAFGFFVSCYASLEEEYAWLQRRTQSGADVPSGRFLSIAVRILGFSRRATILMGAVAVILIAAHGGGMSHMLMDGTVRGVSVTLLLLVAALTVVTRLYRRNFELLFRIESDALAAVRMGRYDVRVPLVSQDEFRKIAEGTNEMIAGLREREEMRDRFGKHFSPEVMDAILRSDRLGGEQKHLAVLFTDLRNYTALSEKLPADQVVAVLNEYFTIVVDAVYRNRGVVDKFIGDAALAYFGFHDPAGACAAAMHTALEIRERMGPMNDALARRGLPALDHGIGIHHGPVIAGTIGAPSRREFTIIGDTVNVASRLESLTKTIGASLLCSAEVHALAGDLQSHLTYLGEHEVKGKSERIKIYGQAAAPPAAQRTR